MIRSTLIPYLIDSHLRDKLKNQVLLFLSGFLQVIFVSSSTYQIAHGFIFGATITGFLVSLIWSYNVKRIAFCDTTDRIIYAFGAGLGSFLGVYVTKFIYELLPITLSSITY
jgi:hypothetical protein